MSDIAKIKHARKGKACFDHEGEFDLDKTIEENRDGATAFEAPGKERKARAKHLVGVHWNLLGHPCPYPSMIHIFLCVIDHANSYSGRCDAGQNTMAIETGFNRKTVRRCLEWLEVNTPFLKIERERPSKRGKFRTNAYHVQWEALEVEWKVIQSFIEGEKQWARHDG